MRQIDQKREQAKNKVNKSKGFFNNIGSTLKLPVVAVKSIITKAPTLLKYEQLHSERTMKKLAFSPIYFPKLLVNGADSVFYDWVAISMF